MFKHKFYGFGKEDDNCPFKDDVKRYLNKRMFSHKNVVILTSEWEKGIAKIMKEFCDEE